MQQAAMRLLAAIADYDYEQYTQDWEKQAVVERMLEIIGEAASRLSPPLKQRYPEVPWGEAIGMRNIVSHEDWPIKNQLVWETATEEVGPLLRQLDRILQQIEDLPGTDR